LEHLLDVLCYLRAHLSRSSHINLRPLEHLPEVRHSWA